MITDPTGLLSDWNRFRLGLAKFAGMDQEKVKRRLEAEERNVIDKRLEDYKKLKESGEVDQIEKEEKKILKMMGDYNRDVVPDSVEDYGGTRVTGEFEDDYQEYKQDPHPGLDFVGGDGFKTPWYTFYDTVNTMQGSHPAILSVSGTKYRIRVKHGDKEDVESIGEIGGGGTSFGENLMFKPGQNIVLYPENQNPPGTPIHFHLEVNASTPDQNLQLVNPLGLLPGKAKEYMYNFGTKSEPNWKPMNQW